MFPCISGALAVMCVCVSAGSRGTLSISATRCVIAPASGCFLHSNADGMPNCNSSWGGRQQTQHCTVMYCTSKMQLSPALHSITFVQLWEMQPASGSLSIGCLCSCYKQDGVSALRCRRFAQAIIWLLLPDKASANLPQIGHTVRVVTSGRCQHAMLHLLLCSCS